MNYCPKCGNKLNENDKFCCKCGERVAIKATTNSLRENNYYEVEGETYVEAKGKNGLSIAGLIVSIVAIVILVLCVTLLFASYNNDSGKKGVSLLPVLLIMASFIPTAASLGLSIPGFILSKRRRIKSALPAISLSFACIAASIFLTLFVIM